MSFILGLLGACIGIILGILIIAWVIYSKVSKTIGKANMKELVEVAKQAKSIEQQEYTREKNVSGITRLIEPTIIHDFGDFNKDFLFSKVEKNLSKIFTAIEEKSISIIENDNDLIYMYSTIRDKITDMKNAGITIKYDELKFHSHAIKNYLKSQGKATITVSSTLEYYYSDSSKSNKNKKYANLKKQTRYTTNYVYVYDETKIKNNEKFLSISCPNCGAPLRKLGGGNCEYCSTYIQPVNLKSWYMISYKEDY